MGEIKWKNNHRLRERESGVMKKEHGGYDIYL